MEDYLQTNLNLETIRSLGACGGGCISDARAYSTDIGELFVKQNDDKEASQMMEGEFESLLAIDRTRTLRVPRPHRVLPHPSGHGSVLVVEYLHFGGLRKHQAQLGKDLARLHLHNRLLKSDDSKVGQSERLKEEGLDTVDQFGFHTTTCCGRIPQNNEWNKDWVEFYSRNKLQDQVNMALRKDGDRQLNELWGLLLRVIPQLFKGTTVSPSLLHGDLWSGNVGESEQGPDVTGSSTAPLILLLYSSVTGYCQVCVAFDPSSFYGHDEFDLAIAGMFGGFSQAFYSAYHSIIPKAPGFSDRHQLYLLFHNLNHWNHFGSSYRSGTMSIMTKLTSKFN